MRGSDKPLSPRRYVVRTVLFAATFQCPFIQLAPGAQFDIANSDEAGLIAAINEPNTNGEPDVINLAENGIYTLTTVDNMADGQNGLPSITDEITINGNGATIRRSAGPVPYFRILHVVSSSNLTLNDLLVRNGQLLDGGTDMQRGGGGILNAGTMTLNHCTIEDDRAGNAGYSGGTFGDQGGSGGGIYNKGILAIADSTIRGNQAGNGEGGTDFGGRGDDGGGIYNKGILAIMTSTLSTNHTGTGGLGVMADGSDGDGGGLYNEFGGDATITATTLSQNVAEGSGGGITNVGRLFVTSGTVTENTANSSGGGVRNYADLDMTHTIIAHQTVGADYAGILPLSLGHNLDSDGTCGLTAAGDMGAVMAMLRPLQDNGGPTQTHALLAGSPAIDAGDTDASTYDQRGYRRPFDGDGNGTSVCDIGACEFFDCNGDTLDDADPTDADDDTIPDACDNCPNVANLDQADENNNRIGDACEASSPLASPCCGSSPVASSFFLLLCLGLLKSGARSCRDRRDLRSSRRLR